MQVVIAGAGIGGLVLAVSLLKQGFDVQVFERDLTAIRGEGKYRGPIQVRARAGACLLVRVRRRCVLVPGPGPARVAWLCPACRCCVCVCLRARLLP